MNRRDTSLNPNIDNEFYRKLLRIQRSTGAFFPFFTRIHDWLRMHSRAYYTLHINRWSTAIHVIILLIVVAINILNFISTIVSYPQVTRAVSCTASGSGTKNWS